MIINNNNRLLMKNDIMFKYFFSKKGHEKYLESFLSAVLCQKVTIKNIRHDARLEQATREDKYGVLDLDVELGSRWIYKYWNANGQQR